MKTFIESIGLLGIAVIVFAESGLFLGAFLPGDSLLFTAGFLASQNILDIRILVPVCFVAAVIGDSFGYSFGRTVGPRIFKREDSLLFHREHLARAQTFYEKHGGKTIIIARFMPVVRTFAPILAGVGRMHYPRFLVFNVIGALFWAVGLTAAGYILGQKIPHIDRYLLPIILAIILTSVAPTVIHILRDPTHRMKLIHASKGFIAKTRNTQHAPLPSKGSERRASSGRPGEAQGEGVSHQPITPIPQDYHNTSLEKSPHVICNHNYAQSAREEFTKRFGQYDWCKQNVRLSQKTTFRLGGPADYFTAPKTLADTQAVLNACHELSIPLFVLGGGSNVLFSDAGWRGVVMQPANVTIAINQEITGDVNWQQQKESPDPIPSRWEAIPNDRPVPPTKPSVPSHLPAIEVRVGAGVSLQQLILKTHQEKLVGLESFSGIPARVGGALRNNVHGGPDNLDRYIKEATLVHVLTGETEAWAKEKFRFSYDHSILQQSRDWLVWDVVFTFPRADAALWQQFDQFFKSWQTYKSQTQTAAGTAGCIYKNIDPALARQHHVPISAGALIDHLFGLGTKLRTVQISSFHGNFLQNHSGEDGSAADMLSLINFIREEAFRRTGLQLDPEIEFVGF